jgi:uncharacterized protein YcaQ
VRTVSVDAARRIALGAQGFGRGRPRGRIDVRHFRKVMSTLGLVQLDSVNVCVRTHYMPFYARLGPYDRDALDRWLNESGENFEYWCHEAAVLPVDRYPLWRWKMASMAPWRRAQALMEEHPEVLPSVLEQVREHGPLTVRDLDAPNHRNEPWWGYGPGKVALELLFADGEVSALRTGNFVRLYDLPERLIPADVLAADGPSREDAHRALLVDAVRHLGIGTRHDVADYFRLNIQEASPILEDLARAGAIDEVSVPGWRGPVYADPNASRPRSISARTLLSPFDPVVWYRERAERLFGFRYRIEIYVPEHKRVHGYYVLPFMMDGALVARADLKADRRASSLMVRSSFIEDGHDPGVVARSLAAELEQFAAWLGLADISVASRGDLAARLRSAL